MFRRILTLSQLWRCQKVGEGVRVYGRVWVHGDGEVEIGRDVVLDGRLAPIELRTGRDGRLIIGECARIESGASLEAEGRVELGARAWVGAYAKIIDNHFHPVTGDRSQRPTPGVVILEEDVTVGHGAILLPGAYIGKGTRVGPRAVVSKRVPPGALITGNPGHVEGVRAG